VIGERALAGFLGLLNSVATIIERDLTGLAARLSSTLDGTWSYAQTQLLQLIFQLSELRHLSICGIRVPQCDTQGCVVLHALSHRFVRASDTSSKASKEFT
jgi:hypothetical protein